MGGRLMRELHLFAGAGGGILGGEILKLNNRHYKNAERAREAMAQMVAAGLAEWDADQKKVRLT